MSRLARRRQKVEQDVDIDMVPVMNMFLVLIPFLLMSASFLHLKAINTSVPVRAETVSEAAPEQKVKVTVIVELGEGGIKMSALADELDAGTLERLDATIEKSKDQEYAFGQMVGHLEQIKSRYPASDTIIVIPEDSVRYHAIIETMDAARYSEETPLFPKVVLSERVG